MGQLPAARVTPTRVLIHLVCDPFEIKNFTGRSKKTPLPTFQMIQMMLGHLKVDFLIGSSLVVLPEPNLSKSSYESIEQLEIGSKNDSTSLDKMVIKIFK
ncbi:hypothetical protein CEXT_304821 [Caerostris extrusa]|uniref:Uncharacterized protein n=1 Tax=Caerostris extrusa TaxID=172846 RepID=A0AAV4SGG6_CAEEX|nr:hypothetical protein CEXT_304821 [Caerostris extrusa]